MIQFNLLPDIKIQYLKARRQEHAVILGAIVATIAAITVLVLLLVVVHGLQKKSLSDLNTDIQSASQELEETPQLDKILTVQNQLGALTGLHDEKLVSSRLFTYLSQVTPSAASISNLEVDFAAFTMSITGTADSLSTVNKYADTLKFTEYTISEDSSEETAAFSEVVLAGFTRNAETTTYNITLKFDPAIFSSDDTIALTVPNIISTRSEVDKPTALFQTEGTQ